MSWAKDSDYRERQPRMHERRLRVAILEIVGYRVRQEHERSILENTDPVCSMGG